jgi:hypothetical protein
MRMLNPPLRACRRRPLSTLTCTDALTLPLAARSVGEGRNKPIVGMTPTASGRGYWFTASDGGVFAFGDASFGGSAGDRGLKAPVVALVARR